jgi:hypothetical protein
VKKDHKRFPDDPDARGALPPTLVGQGERTQPDWLYNFLLDPQPIRRLAILRMPKFNMSKDEARMLVDYFAAVTRQTNPGIGLAYPHEVIIGREDISGEYWRKKTSDYVAYLKKTKQMDKDGKELGSLFDARKKEYEPVWKRVKSLTEPGLRAKLDDLEAAKKKKEAEKDFARKKLDPLKDAKDPKDLAKKAELETEVALADAALATIKDEKSKVEKAQANLDVKVQQTKWETEEAYATDAYRMLTSRELCTKCHQIGNTVASASDPTAKQGPPLDVVFSRLRPEWIERWVDKPQRFVPYQSLMIAYFNKDELKFQNLHAGPAQEQISALRDVLMNYEQISKLPINRVHNPDRR